MIRNSVKADAPMTAFLLIGILVFDIFKVFASALNIF